MPYTTLDKLVNQYANHVFSPVDNADIDPRELAKEKLKMDIIEEIVAEKKEEYRKAVREEMNEELEKARITYWKAFIVDGLFIAFLVGIVVNQCTEIISWIKNVSEKCIEITLLAIIASICLVFLVLKYRYINKIENFLKENSKYQR